MPRGRPKAFDASVALRAALDLFWQKGYDATSVGDLVEATGLGRQSLYNEFGDKRQLFAATLLNYRQSETGAMIAILGSDHPVRCRIREFFRVAVDAHFDEKRRGCFLTSSIAIRSDADNELKDLMNRCANDLKDAFIDCIRDGIDNGEFGRAVDPIVIGTLFFTQAQGISIVGKCQDCRLAIEQGIEALLKTLD